MHAKCFALIVISPFLPLVAAQDPQPSLKDPQIPFWSAPKLKATFSPTAVDLVSHPDPMREFAMLKIGDRDPKKFKVLNPAAKALLKDAESTYTLVANGLHLGAHPYVDRKQKITKIDNALL